VEIVALVPYYVKVIIPLIRDENSIFKNKLEVFIQPGSGADTDTLPIAHVKGLP
jgi:hypothetical protein